MTAEVREFILHPNSTASLSLILRPRRAIRCLKTGAVYDDDNQGVELLHVWLASKHGLSRGEYETGFTVATQRY